MLCLHNNAKVFLMLNDLFCAFFEGFSLVQIFNLNLERKRKNENVSKSDVIGLKA